MKLAYRMQDMDGDGTISRSDLTEYMLRVTEGHLSDEILAEIVTMVFLECASDPTKEHISFADFQRIVAPTDFHAKFHISL